MGDVLVFPYMVDWQDVGYWVVAGIALVLLKHMWRDIHGRN